MAPQVAWLCCEAFKVPVVPEVKIESTMSSAGVGSIGSVTAGARGEVQQVGMAE